MGRNFVDSPLVLKACLDGRFGTIHTYTDGRIYEALFIYLDGNVNFDLIKSFKSRWGDRMFVCLTTIWQEALITTYPEIFCRQRHVMAYQFSDEIDKLVEITRHIPTGYQLRVFDEDAFSIKPFGFGSNYKSYDYKQRQSYLGTEI